MVIELCFSIFRLIKSISYQAYNCLNSLLQEITAQLFQVTRCFKLFLVSLCLNIFEIQFVNVMAGLGPLIKPILHNTFIEDLVDELNKLEHKNNKKIRDIDEIDNKVPESRRYSSTN